MFHLKKAGVAAGSVVDDSFNCMSRLSVEPDLVAFEPQSIRVIGITKEQYSLKIFFSFIFSPDLWRV